MFSTKVFLSTALESSPRALTAITAYSGGLLYGSVCTQRLCLCALVAACQGRAGLPVSAIAAQAERCLDHFSLSVPLLLCHLDLYPQPWRRLCSSRLLSCLLFSLPACPIIIFICPCDFCSSVSSSTLSCLMSLCPSSLFSL